MKMDLTIEEFKEMLSTTDLAIVADFYAPWCGPCKRMAPMFEALSEELDGFYQLVKLNVDQNPELAEQYQITSLPTLVFINKDGKEVGRKIGAMEKEALTDLIRQYLG